MDRCHDGGIGNAGASALFFVGDNMANLTPELLKLLEERYAQGAGGSGWAGAMEYADPNTGMRYAPLLQTSGVTDAGDGGSTLSGIVADDGQQWYKGQRGYSYDPQGNLVSDFELNDPTKRDWGKTIAGAMIAAMTGGAAYGAMGGAIPSWAGGTGAASGASGGSGLAGSISNGLNSIGTSIGNGVNSIGSGISGLFGGGGSELASGAFLGEGMASGVPLWDAAATGAGLSLATPLTTGMATKVGGNFLSNPLVKAGLSLGAGALSGKTPSTSQTSTRTTDPRMDPYLYGDGGLLQYTQQQLNRDMSPERIAERDKQRSIGMGLLSRPIAGNGFDRFFPGR